MATPVQVATAVWVDTVEVMDGRQAGPPGPAGKAGIMVRRGSPSKEGSFTKLPF